VRALVASQLRPLDETVRRVLELVAAGGAAEMSLNQLLTAAGGLKPPLSPAALFDALDCALQTRILLERNGGYAFRHPLVGSTLNQELWKHRREQIRASTNTSARQRSRRLSVSPAR
jgi:predicted ATPase